MAPLPAAAAAARALGRLGLVRAGSSRHRTGCAWFTCLTCLTGSMSGCLIGLAVTGGLIAVVGANAPPLAMAHSCATSKAPCALTLGAGVVAPIRCGGLHATQGYGETPWEHPHTGIDVVCPAGTVVVAVTSGVFHRRAGSGGCAYPAGASGGLGTYGELDAADASAGEKERNTISLIGVQTSASSTNVELICALPEGTGTVDDVHLVAIKTGSVTGSLPVD